MSAGTMRMTLAGLDPELRKSIKVLTETFIRAFDGAPEHVQEFRDATDLWVILTDLETSDD